MMDTAATMVLTQEPREEQQVVGPPATEGPSPYSAVALAPPLLASALAFAFALASALALAAAPLPPLLPPSESEPDDDWSVARRAVIEKIWQGDKGDESLGEDRQPGAPGRQRVNSILFDRVTHPV